MLNNTQKRTIARDYPYPLIIEFQRLNTPELKEYDLKRIKKIFDVLELTLQYLSLVLLCDMIDIYKKEPYQISDGFRKEFKKNFTMTTLGSWKNLLNGLIQICKKNQLVLFIPELYNYLLESDGKDSEVMMAIQEMTHIRNEEIEHAEEKYLNRSRMKDLCLRAEELIDLILIKLDFIRNYQLVHVSKVTVNYPRWTSPSYHVEYTNIAGNNPELFDIITEVNSNIMHSPTLIIKMESNNYLNLEPLILFSEEGRSHIPDIFMYLNMNKEAIKYRPIFVGGLFNLKLSLNFGVLIPELLEFFKVFGTQENYNEFCKYYGIAL